MIKRLIFGARNVAARIGGRAVRVASEEVGRVSYLHRKLQVPRDYAERGLPFYREASSLVSAPTGRDGRNLLMTPATQSQWLAMHSAARKAGIELFIQWAFRSLDQQAALVRAELLAGRTINEALTLVAAPGYSEHHTGQALDIGSDDCFPLTGDFEHTKAFFGSATTLRISVSDCPIRATIGSD